MEEFLCEKTCYLLIIIYLAYNLIYLNKIYCIRKIRRKAQFLIRKQKLIEILIFQQIYREFSISTSCLNQNYRIWKNKCQTRNYCISAYFKQITCSKTNFLINRINFHQKNILIHLIQNMVFFGIFRNMFFQIRRLTKNTLLNEKIINVSHKS